MYVFKRNSLESNSGRLQLTSENMTYGVQIPIDLIKPGKCVYIIITVFLLTVIFNFETGCLCLYSVESAVKLPGEDIIKGIKET